MDDSLRAPFLLQYLSMSPVGIKNERCNRTWPSSTSTANLHPYRNQTEWVLYVVRMCKKLNKDRYLQGIIDVRCEV